MKRIIYNLVLASLTVVLVSLAPAQTSSPQSSSQATDQSSLGDYARKVRKDTGSPKAKPKVFDNDNIPVTDKLSVVGQKPADDAAAPAEDKDKDKDKTAATNSDDTAKKQAAWKDWQSKLTAQKDSIDLAARELDVLQREYELRAAAMYADAGNRLRNETQWDKQNADYKQKIADKTKAVEDAKQKLTDMQEEARKAGVPSAMIE